MPPSTQPALTRPDGSEPQDFHLTRRGAASLFFAGYALAAVSAEAAPITTSAEGLVIAEPLIPNGDQKPLPAYLARPAGEGRHPAILVASEIFGIHDYIKDVCRRFAHLGYVALAPSFFYRSGVDLAAMTDIVAIRAVVAQAGEGQVDGDLRAATAWLKAQPFVEPDRIGVNGFCWGGAVAWRSAMIDPDVRAAVAWYGQLKPLFARVDELKVPVLGLYGGLDQGIPMEDVAVMDAALKRAGKTGSSLHLYPDAKHGFHADYRASYNEADAEDGWARMLAFFKANGVA